ncbi:MAG: DUF4202 family protein [Patescibacteria group bacterium]|nr:DUF4202 family protein [Patescibacteria group bacterium]MDD5715399.1 DUF4202 family protein [Patescibacteria group bacterium]
MARFEDIRKEIEAVLPKSPVDFELRHAQLVLKLVLKLKPDADEALQIAALAHDMERAYTGITEKDLKDYSKIDEFKKEHALRSVRYITELLTKHQYPQEAIDKVSYLVSNHEVGGDAEANILKDADSLAFFEYNIPSCIKRNGDERCGKKIKFMYVRLSDGAKAMVRHITYEDPKIGTFVGEALKNI